jgi:asparagine synthase (glutamine-hydrolysing)
MCGIVGEWKKSVPVEPRVFDSMVESLAHRGPDSRGTKMLDDGKLALGHLRLSIIDLSDAGIQPMCNEDGSVWLTFNGEIYNYASLREKLLQLGHTFRSQTDSETIIHAYEEWGVDCLSRFRGIFAFALYDGRRSQLFLARDHMGVKPLYYYQAGGRFMFASEPRAVLAGLGQPPAIDLDAFSLYLAYGNVPADASIYRRVRKLLPGHCLLLNDKGLDVRQYWKVRYNPTISDPREAEAAVQAKVEECVRAQSVSDVPVATLLSGGIDSTAVTSILTERGRKPILTFNVGFTERESDEREYARFAAAALRTEHHERVLDYADACTLLPHAIDSYDEPFHLNGVIPFYSLSRLVQDNRIKVVQGGDGADEMFAGYLWYDQFSRLNDGVASSPWLQKFFGALRFNQPDARPNLARQFFRYNGFLDEGAQRVIAGSSLGSRDFDDIYAPLEAHWQPDMPLALAAQLMDFNCFLVDHCLTKVDRASMACGVEARVPFLDIELVELVFSIDHDIVYRAGRRKALLKDALKQHLPDGMNLDRKKGFSSPLDRWLSQGLAAAGGPLVRDGSLCSRGILDSASVASRYPRMTSGQQLLLISAELWCRRWIENDRQSVARFAEGLPNALTVHAT